MHGNACKNKTKTKQKKIDYFVNAYMMSVKASMQQPDNGKKWLLIIKLITYDYFAKCLAELAQRVREEWDDGIVVDIMTHHYCHHLSAIFVR